MNNFNPDRYQLSVLLDEYLNEASPVTESQISYHATYRLVQKYVDGITFHDVTRAVRYFSPTYMVTFENYVGILKIFFDEQTYNYNKKAEQSIKNILLNIINENTKVSNQVLKIIDSLQDEFTLKNFDKLPIINMLKRFVKKPDSNDIQKILNKMVTKDQAQQKIKGPTTTISQKDFKVHIHILDLFNVNKCTSFLDVFKENNDFQQGTMSLKIGFAVECQLRNNKKFSKMVFIKTSNDNNITNQNDENTTNQNNENTTNQNNENTTNQNDENATNQNDENITNQNDDNSTNQNDIDPIYYRIDDTITLEFTLTEEERKREKQRSDDDNIFLYKKNGNATIISERDSGYEMVMNSPLIIKLYTIIIPNTIISSPMKFLYGYLKVNLVPILFAHGHEIQLSGNFIPLENQLNKNQISLFYGTNNIPKTTEDPVMLSFSLKTDIDPYICYSSPLGQLTTKIDGRDILEIREKTIMNSNSRSCQISALDEQGNSMNNPSDNNNVYYDIHHFLCFYVDANIQFDTDDLFELLIRDSRKPGPNYSPIVRSPFALYNNLFFNIDTKSSYKDVLYPPMLFKDDSTKFFEFSKEMSNINFSKSTKMTQLERCIVLCCTLIKSNIPAFVCCGSIDMCDTYCVINLSKNQLSPDKKGKFLHMIPGHVYPISLLSYSINSDQSNRMDKMSSLRLNNLFDFNFSSSGKYKDYKSIHIWCLSDILNDAISASFHITTIFNDTNVWINRQQNTSILRINWDIDDDQLWYPVLENTDNDQIKQYVYSKRKITFLKSYDKVKYEFYFNYEFEKYAEEHFIQIDKKVHNLIVSNKKELFSKSPFNDLMKKLDGLLDKVDKYIKIVSKKLKKIDKILKESDFNKFLDSSVDTLTKISKGIDSISDFVNRKSKQNISRQNMKNFDTIKEINNRLKKLNDEVVFLNGKTTDKKIDNGKATAKKIDNEGNLKLKMNDLVDKILKLKDMWFDYDYKAGLLINLNNVDVDDSLKQFQTEINTSFNKFKKISENNSLPSEINKLPELDNNLSINIKKLSFDVDNINCSIDNTSYKLNFDYQIEKISYKIKHLSYLVNYLSSQINCKPLNTIEIKEALNNAENCLRIIGNKVDDEYLKDTVINQVDYLINEINEINMNTNQINDVSPIKINRFQTKFENLACRIDNLNPVITNFRNVPIPDPVDNFLSIDKTEEFKKVVNEFLEKVNMFIKTENINQETEEKDKKSETEEKDKKSKTEEKDKKSETEEEDEKSKTEEKDKKPKTEEDDESPVIEDETEEEDDKPETETKNKNSKTKAKDKKSKTEEKDKKPETKEKDKKSKTKEKDKKSKTEEKDKKTETEENEKQSENSENNKEDKNQENKKQEEETNNFNICLVSTDTSDFNMSGSSDSSIIDEFEFIGEVNLIESSQSKKNFFFRKIEAPYFMMPDELLEYIIENNGLRFINSFDIIIDFTPLPLNNCKIDIIIVYDAGRYIYKKKT